MIFRKLSDSLVLSVLISLIASSAWAVNYGGTGLYNRGVQLLNQQKPREAIPYFDAAIKSSPTLAQAYVNKGVALDQLGYHEQAIECYTQAIKVEPKLSVAYDNRGTTKLALKRYAEALDDFNKSISLPRVSPLGGIFIYGDRARAYAGLHRWKECFRDFDYVLKHPPTSDPRFETLKRMAGVHYRVAQLQFAADIAQIGSDGEKALRNGEFQKAIEMFDKSLELKPNQPELIAMKAQAFVQLKQDDEALKTINKAIEVDPRKAPLRVARALINISLKHYPDAIADITDAMSKGMVTGNNYRLRGVAEFLAGQSDAAIKDLDQAIYTDPKDKENYFLRALAATAAGDSSKAIECADKYLELTEWNGPSAREALAVAFLAKSKSEGNDSAQKIFDQRPKDGENEKFCIAASMIGFLKKEKSEADVATTCNNSVEKDAVANVGAWLKIRGADKKDESLEQLKSYINKGDPLETPYLLAVTIIRESSLKTSDSSATTTDVQSKQPEASADSKDSKAAH